MFGWSSCGEGTASRRKRASRSGSLGHLGGQDFDRHVAAEFRVGGAIHLAHSTRADRSGDPIMRERTTDQSAPPGSQAVISCGLCRMATAAPILH